MTFQNLGDFKSESCWTFLSYIILWVFLLVSISVYAVDTFTAINLLAFSRWAGRVQPAIPFNVSRWIFAVCILVSFALLIYRWYWAYRAIRSGSIAKSYLNELAVRVQCFRVFGSKGRGWQRFLVFAELTKSKKGAEYVALYTYFSFQLWMNTVFADGPRQAINAITLYSVLKMDLLPGGVHAPKDDGSSQALQFFNNVKNMAEHNNLQAVVLFGMLFTLVIWILSILKLASAVILYLIFLFHHIPQEDGTLKAYCRRKISSRLKRIVQRKVNKALAKGFQLQDRAPTQPSLGSVDSQPTLPDLDKKPIVNTLSRSTTQTTLPPYTRSNSAAEQLPTLPNIEFDSKPPLTRSTTQSSAVSESVSLTGNAALMGYSPLDRQPSPLPPVPPLPAGVPPRMGSVQPRPTPCPTPFTHDKGRSSPAPTYRTLPDAGAQAYRTFTPATDPYTRANTPGTVIPDEHFDHSYHPAQSDPYAPAAVDYGKDEYEYDWRSYTPVTQRTMTPQSRTSPQDTYRSYTPASTGAAPRSLANRSMTPASYRGTPAPQGGEDVGPPPRTFTPMNPVTPSGPQSGYTTFNPMMNSQTPQPRMQRPPPMGAQPFARANTASPSVMNRNGPPAGYSFDRANTNQF